MEVKIMELSEVNEKYAQLKEKYWKPEWDSLSEDEKIKDSQYAYYLHEMLVIGLKFAKGQKVRCESPEAEELMDEMIKFYEKSLKCFSEKEV